VKNLLSVYQKSGNTDWLTYRHSNPHSYARNLIYISMTLEAVLLVWEPGQVSCLHDHNGNNCFFLVLEGSVKEVQYALQQQDEKTTLKETTTSYLTVGDCGFIPGELDAIHQISGPGVTLHIYNRPIYKCRAYCPHSGYVGIRRPGFYSIQGKVLDADSTLYTSIYDALEAEEKKQAEKCSNKALRDITI